MSDAPRPAIKLLTVVTEAALDHAIQRDLKSLGATGYTITDARGRGSRGARAGSWDASGNIRIEVLGREDTVRTIAEHLQKRYYDNYAMIIWVIDAQVLRPGKFGA
jgi:peptidoglycan hydrolase-like protein with peptidoglycan-binding domain